jgi:predicted negative regulator of RcsB-dependent stress response
MAHSRARRQNATISACVLSGQQKNWVFAMQAQDATTLFLLKLWPWVEANRNRLIAGTVVVLIAIFVVWFVACQRDSKAVAAGQALTQATLLGGAQLADAYAKVAAEYPGTIAGQRALLQSAATMFEAGNYRGAQAQFQKFLGAHPDSEFSGQALLGVATSLDAQNETNLAASAYQRVINNASSTAVVGAAKFGLGRIDEAQGRVNDALVLYQDVASAEPNDLLGHEAAMRLMELRRKQPAPAPAAAPTVPMTPANKP